MYAGFEFCFGRVTDKWWGPGRDELSGASGPSDRVFLERVIFPISGKYRHGLRAARSLAKLATRLPGVRSVR
jgi:hypothetical protein